MFYFVNISDSEVKKNDASVMDVVFVFMMRAISITRQCKENGADESK